MKRMCVWIVVLLASVGALAQTAGISNHCTLGGTAAKTSGLSSTNFLQGIIPSCTVTVYLTGTQTKAIIFSDINDTPLSNPFTANAANSVNPGGWQFWTAINQGYDIVMSGGIPPNAYSTPVTLVAQYPGFSFTGGGGGSPSIAGTIQGANAGADAFISSEEIIGTPIAGYATPEAAVAEACATSQAVYFPAGTYTLTTGILGCTGLRLRCASSDVFGNTGTIFQLQPGAAIWGFSNPNADSTSGTPNANVNQGMYIDNCKFDISQDSAALGAMRIKGMRFNKFSHISVFSNLNPVPSITFDGSNSGHNDGDYDNFWDGLNLWENGSNSTSTAISMLVSSNQNTFIGGVINRFGTDINIASGNGNVWVGTDGEGWLQNAIVLASTASVAGNQFIRFRTETGWLSWVANQSGFGVGTRIIDINGNLENATSCSGACTNGATQPSWCTTVGCTTTSGTVTWTLVTILPTDVIASGSVANIIDVTCGFENCIQDTTAFNTYPNGVNYGSVAAASTMKSQQFVSWSNNFHNMSMYLNTNPGDTSNIWAGSCADGYVYCLAINGVTGGEIQASRAFVLGNPSSSVGLTGYTRIFGSAAAGTHEDLTIPNTNGTPQSFLISGQDLIASPTANYSGGGNFGSQAVRWQGSYPGVGVFSGNYVSGGSCTGTGTANLTAFNNGSTATATVKVTAGVISTLQSDFVVTFNGIGATAAPNTATISSGTGTACTSATVNVSTILTAALDQYICNVNLGTGPNPTSDLACQHTGSQGVATWDFVQFNERYENTIAAIAGGNSNAPSQTWFSNWNDGTAQHNDSFSLTPTFSGSGASRTNTWILSHSGTATFNADFSGANTFTVNNLTVNGTCSGCGGGGGGVTSINGTAGAFTFSGGGVSCTTTTCTFSGGGGSFSALTGDATSTSTGGATTVLGINGTLLSGLATGPLCNTTSTGVPFICTSANAYPGTAALATSLAGGATGALPYQSAAATTAYLSGNTAATDQVVVSHGTGSSAQPPTLSNAPALSAANMTGYPTVRSIPFAAGTTGGSTLSTGPLGYFWVPIGCTITGWSISVDTGTATVKTMKVANGTANPTIGSNSISTSGESISTGTFISSSTVSDFTTTTITAGDIVGAQLTATTAGYINFQLKLGCTQ
jgi:hypothetical protein